MRLQKGQIYKHKDLCQCFRCSGISWQTGKTHETDSRIPRPWLGKKRTEDTKLKISINRIGKTTNENHPGWKGDNVGYRALHDWIQRNLGKAQICSFNPEHINTFRYEWANVSLSYKRDIEDWTSLCVPCHRQYDMIRRGGVYH